MTTLTVVVLLIPLVFLALGLSLPPPQGSLLFWTGLALVLLYGWIWLWLRPLRFEITPTELVLVWPLRRASVPRADIRGARCLEREAFRSEFGRAARVGAGGLWGGFGWLWTARRGWLDLYVSRLGGWVVVERLSGRSLLLTPERPDEFVRALR